MSLLFDPISTLDPYRRQMFEAVETGSVETVEQILVRHHSDNEFFAHLATFRGYKNIYDLLNISIDSRYLTNMYVVNGCYDQNLPIRENIEHPYTLEDEDLYEQILRDHPNDFKVRLSIMRVCIRHSFEELLLRIVRDYPDTDPPIYIDPTLLDQWSMGRVIDYLYDPETAKPRDCNSYDLYGILDDEDLCTIPYVTKSNPYRIIEADLYFRSLANNHRYVKFCTSIFDESPRIVENRLTLLHAKMRTDYKNMLTYIGSYASLDTLTLWLDPERSQDNAFVAAGTIFSGRLNSYEFIGIDLSNDISYVANVYLAHDCYEEFQRLFLRNRNDRDHIFQAPIWRPKYASEITYIRLFEEVKNDTVYSMLRYVVERKSSYERLTRILREDVRWNDRTIDDLTWKDEIAKSIGKIRVEKRTNDSFENTTTQQRHENEWEYFRTTHTLSSLNITNFRPKYMYESLSEGCIENWDIANFLERKKMYRIVRSERVPHGIPTVTVVRDDRHKVTFTLDNLMNVTRNAKFLTKDWIYLYDMFHYILFEQYDAMKVRFVHDHSWNEILCSIADFLGDCKARDIVSIDTNCRVLPDGCSWNCNLRYANHLQCSCEELHYPDVHPWTCSEHTYLSNMPQKYHYKREKIFDFGVLLDIFEYPFDTYLDGMRGYSILIALYNTLPIIIALLDCRRTVTN